MNGFDSFWDNLIEKANTNSTLMSRPVHQGNDGLMYCDKCNHHANMWIDLPFGRRLVNCTCPCIDEENKRLEKQAEQQKKLAKAESNRRAGIESDEMRQWTFESDDGSRSRVIEIAKRYCAYFESCKADGFGMVFCGEVGTGKTFTAVCIANRLISQGYTVQVSNFADIVGKIQQDFSERNSCLKKLTDLDLLIIDDLSAERNSEYMNEQIFSVIDARYKAKQPMIFTTNLRADEIKEPVETIKKRIYSRIVERCRIVEFEGANRRKNNGRLNLQKYDGIFNF